MDRILLNEKAVRKNRALRKLNRTARKAYGKSGRPVIKSKLCKLVNMEERTVRNMAGEADILKGSLAQMPASAKELLEVVRRKGLVGMSGSGFPVEKKIEAFMEAAVPEKILIINAAECEPGLVHDEWLIKNRYREVCQGAEILKKCLDIDRCVVAEKTGGLESEGVVEVCRVPARYPMGAERILIEQVMGRRLEKGELPARLGILVMNVQTVYQLLLACRELDTEQRYVTLMNIDTGAAVVAQVAYGSDIKRLLIEEFGIENEFYAGEGLLHAHPLNEGECFDEKICFAAAGHAVESYSMGKCKGCGKCQRVCPMQIKVKEIVRRRDKNPQADISGLGAERCLHCNSCAYVCAAHKNVSGYMET